MTVLDWVVILAAIIAMVVIGAMWWLFIRYVIKTSEPIEVKWVKGSRTFTDAIQAGATSCIKRAE